MEGFGGGGCAGSGCVLEMPVQAGHDGGRDARSGPGMTEWVGHDGGRDTRSSRV